MKVAVVILNWNGVDFLDDFLAKVVEYSAPHEVIVADNCSTDNSIEFLKTNFPKVRVIQNESNGGFAKGYNDALKQVDADLYVLLNSDIEVTENWLEPMISVMQDETIAACQPKILSFKNKSKFEHAGAAGGFLDKNYYPFCRGRIFDAVEEDSGQYDTATEIFWATGAAMMVRSKLYHENGGLDEEFFAHMEEIDLCWRMKKGGHKLMAVPSSTVYHVGGGTLDYLSPRKTFLNFRNSLFMIHKNHEGFLFGKIFYRLILDGVAGAKFLAGFQFKHFASIIKAHFAYYGKVSTLSQKRKAIQEKNKNSVTNWGGFYGASILFAKFFKGIKKYKELNMRHFK